MKSTSSRQNGFSLIEATMAFAIVALLAAVAIPGLIGTKDSADKAALIVCLRSMHTDQVAYHTTRTRYARLTELNTFSGSLYGEVWGTTLKRKGWTFQMSPNPTDSTLRTRYSTQASKSRSGKVVSIYTIAQDGVVQTVK